MANASSPNEYVTGLYAGVSDTGFYAVWRLVRTLIAAGWTVAQSGNGVASFGASDYWNVAPTALGNGCWIVLTGPGSRQICFWRDTAGSYWTGKIIYSKSGGHTFASASASNPGTLPATAQYVRGSGAAVASWFGGGSKSIRYLSVMAKDVSDGSFWVIGSTPGTSNGSFYHAFAFFSLATYTASDTDPYVFFCAGNSVTADATTTANGHVGGSVLNGNSDTASNGYYIGWARNANWKYFSPVYEAIHGTVSPMANPYSTGAPLTLLPVGVGKVEASFRERKGTIRYARYTAMAGLVNGETLSDGANAFRWVVTGYNGAGTYPQALWWWDGATPWMALDA